MRFAHSRFLTATTASAVALVGLQFLSASAAQAAQLDPDAAFNSAAGVLSINNSVSHIEVESDGKIVVASGSGFMVKRINTDGSLDQIFTPAGSGAVLGLGVLANGDIVTSDTSVGLQVWDSTGATSNTFVTPISYGGPLAVRADGKILAISTSTNNAVLKLVDPSSGAADSSFSTNQAGAIATSAMLSAVTEASDGKIVVCGDGVLVRLNADGSPDTAFNTAAATSFSGMCSDVKVQSDGKVVVSKNLGMAGGQSKGLLRLNVDGTVDTAFAAALPNSANGTMRSLALVNGYIYAASNNRLLRFGGDGSGDTAFNTSSNGTVGLSSMINRIAITSSGKLYAGLSSQSGPFVQRYTIDTPTYTPPSNGGSDTDQSTTTPTPTTHEAKSTIYFDKGKAHLSSYDKKKIKAVVNAAAGTVTTVKVTGYAAPKNGHYKTLAGKRAAAVKSYLKKLGIKVSITTAKAKSTKKQQGRAKVVISYTTTS